MTKSFYPISISLPMSPELRIITCLDCRKKEDSPLPWDSDIYTIKDHAERLKRMHKESYRRHRVLILPKHVWEWYKKLVLEKGVLTKNR